MKEIIMPQNSGTQTENLPLGYRKYAVPDSLQEKDRIELFSEQVQAVVSRQIEIEQTIDKYKDEVKEYSQDIKKSTNRNIEIIGLFSSVLALLIISVNVISSATSFLTSILLIIGLTCTVAIFSILIHSFFNSDVKTSISKSFWIPMVILIILLLFGIFAETANLEFNKNVPSIEKTTSTKL